jgi:membrane fusion protein, multidrug efflux system
MMSRRRSRADFCPRASFLLATSLVLAACNSKAARPEKPQLLVRTQAVSFENYVTTIALTGEIQARTQTNLSFRVSGRIVARNADVGQHVDAGAVLASIDPAEPQADLDAANAAVTAAEALLRQTSAAFDRQRTLLSAGYATRSASDSAQQALRAAEASLDAARAQAASAKDALSYAELRTERPGVVTARNVEVGQVAQAAQTAFTLAEDGPRDAVFNVYESIFFLKPAKDVVELSLVTDPLVRANGKVREVAPTVDAKTGTVAVKVAVEDPPPEMSLGSAVKGVGTFVPRQVVILPWSSAAIKDSKLAVWIVDPAAKSVSLRSVEAENFEKEKLIIRGGLKPGELVVTEGGKFLFPGEVVSVAEAAP